MQSARQISTGGTGSAWGSTVLLLVIALSGLSCSDPAGPDPLPLPPVSAAISDGAHDGAAGFYFLPPMVPRPQYYGVLETGYDPVVTICEWDTTADQCDEEVVKFGMDFGDGSEVLRLVLEDEHYIVNWHLDRFALTDGATYRVSVTVEGHVLGFADVVIFASMQEARNEITGESIALLDGRTLPIKFRIEEIAIPEAALALDPTSVAFEAYAGDGDPAPAMVQATNLGVRPLGEVALGTIVYDGDVNGWLAADMDGPAAPADVSIQAMTAGLAPGTYRAQVPVTATMASNSPQLVEVTFKVVANTVPTASAGANQEVGPGETVTLDGSGSSDPDEGQSLTYSWTQTGGPAVVLSATDAVMPTFTAPSGAEALEFSLVVSDGIATSSPDEVVVTVVEPPTNEILSAKALFPDWLPNEHSVKISYRYVTGPACTAGATMRVVPVSAALWGDEDFLGQPVWLYHERDMPAGEGTIVFNIQKIVGPPISTQAMKVGMFCAGDHFPFFEQELTDVRLSWYPSGNAPLAIRNWSQFDVNEVDVGWKDDLDEWHWLQATSNLSLWREPTGTHYTYNDEVIINLQRRHPLTAEPDVDRYYVVRYVQECIDGSASIATYFEQPLYSPSMAVGVHHLPGYALLRETYFIFDWPSQYSQCVEAAPGYRYEQILRGPDGQIYVYKSWYEPRSTYPEGLRLLEELGGYGGYQLSDFER